ncbi:MAG: hypothetical protein V7629_13310, partial [Motiliproteus sp.]
VQTQKKLWLTCRTSPTYNLKFKSAKSSYELNPDAKNVSIPYGASPLAAVMLSDMCSMPEAPAFKLKKRILMAKPNFTFEKRQKELAKKKKQEEKRLKKQDKSSGTDLSEQPPASESP